VCTAHTLSFVVSEPSSVKAGWSQASLLGSCVGPHSPQLYRTKTDVGRDPQSSSETVSQPLVKTQRIAPLEITKLVSEVLVEFTQLGILFWLDGELCVA
jgi:hypothetical protein